MRYITQYTHYIRDIKQKMLDRSQEVCNPLFSLFSPGSLSQGDTSIWAEQLTTTCWVYWKGRRVRWQRDYLDTDLLIRLILSHNHYDKFSWHDSSCIWVWAPYKTISKQKETEHEDVMKWKLVPRHWPFVRGIHQSPITWADVYPMLDRRNWLANTQMAGDRGHHDAHATSLEWNFV